MAKEAPPKGRIEKFWEGIWGEKKLVICLQAGKGTRRKKEKVKEQEWENIELKAALTKYQNWGSSGIDKVPNFLLNALSSPNVTFTSLLNAIMQNPEKTPE